MRILVFGGTRFFGKRLVQLLINEGHEVTIYSRGTQKDSFGDQISRLIGDRKSKQDIEKNLNDREFDIVYDQIGFNALEAKLLTDYFEDQSIKLIFASSCSVYAVDGGENLKEADLALPSELSYETEVEYHTGKQLAELQYTKASFPVISVRLPFVLGEDDYTERTKWHVDRVLKDESIYMPNPEAFIPVAHARNVAHFLSALKEIEFSGPINMSDGNLKLRDLIDSIKPGFKLAAEHNENHSPYGIDKSVMPNCDLAKRLGLPVVDDVPWLDDLIQHFSEQEK